MKNKLIYIRITALMLSGILTSCPNPWVRDLTDPLFKKDPPRIQGFEWIRPGSFTMGSSDTVNDYGADPPHQVKLTKGFYMGKYEVTQEQWLEVMGSNPSFGSSSPAAGEVQEKRPVEQVRWYDVLVFCNRLSIQEGLMPVYSILGSTNPDSWGTVPTALTDPNKADWDAVTVNWNAKGYRLPTEAEWEYACRAGTTTAYNTGENISDNTGLYNGNSIGMTHEVGKKPANKWGLYDMHGNVAECCWDWFDDYDSSGNPETNPTGAVISSVRMIRGGAYNDTLEDLRSASRSQVFPYFDTYSAVGFRLVRNQ